MTIAFAGIKPRVLLMGLVGVAAVAGAGAIGFAIGNDHAPVETIHTGIVYESPGEGTASAGGFNYFLPVDVSWVDATGTIHDASQHPPCIRFYHAGRAVFATVKYSIAGATQGTVVWVQC